MKKIIFVLIIVTIFVSCKKQGEVCYECKDALGNIGATYCAENEDAAFNQAYGGTMNGVIIDTKAKFLAACPKK